MRDLLCGECVDGYREPQYMDDGMCDGCNAKIKAPFKTYCEACARSKKKCIWCGKSR